MPGFQVPPGVNDIMVKKHLQMKSVLERGSGPGNSGLWAAPISEEGQREVCAKVRQLRDHRLVLARAPRYKDPETCQVVHTVIARSVPGGNRVGWGAGWEGEEL